MSTWETTILIAVAIGVAVAIYNEITYRIERRIIRDERKKWTG